MHLMSVGAKKAIELILRAGQVHDAPQGRLLMETVGKQNNTTLLIMDKAYEDDETRSISQMLGFFPVVPPKKKRKYP